MDSLNESFLNRKEKEEASKEGPEKMGGLGEASEDNVEDKIEETEPWGYEILPNGELGAVDGLVDPEAGDLNQESPEPTNKDELVEVIMNGSEISLVSKDEEDLTVFFDTLEEISRNLFISENPEVVEKSEKLRDLVRKYRVNSDDFIKENPTLDFGRLFDSK